MALFDATALLEPISSDSPCGENLEYDADFIALEQAALGKPEQQFGKTIIPSEPPDWKTVEKHAVALLTRSKDLRVAAYLVRSGVRNHGFPGLVAALAVVEGLLERYWPGVHPALDPEDDNDPTLRVNTIAGLCDPASMLRPIREAPLARSRLGVVSYRDVLIAAGELTPPKDYEKLDENKLTAAFSDCAPDELRAVAKNVQQSREHSERIEALLTDQVGASRAANLEDLRSLLSDISKHLTGRLSQRGLTLDEPIAEEQPAPSEEGQVAPSAPSAPSTQARIVVVAPPPGEFHSREDVVRGLEKMCEYYAKYEPSSPIPLLLNRAKRLASKSFLEILRDLTPDAVGQALSLGGITEDPSGS